MEFELYSCLLDDSSALTLSIELKGTVERRPKCRFHVQKHTEKRVIFILEFKLFCYT